MNEFEELKALLDNPEWPESISPDLICNVSSEKEKTERAGAIIDFVIDKNLSDLKFLDFGTGEGHIAKEASKMAKFSVGYDLKKSGSLEWEETQSNYLLTTDLNKVKEHGPFDVILLYDVLDHDHNPVHTLKTIKDLASGCVYVRCHPWTSRHGSHLYQTINKAFIHLVFTPDELQSMNYHPEYNRKVMFPRWTYDKWINEAGLKKSQENEQVLSPEEFFIKNQLIKNRIKANWDKPSEDEFPIWGIQDFPKGQTELCFIDYVLTK